MSTKASYKLNTPKRGQGFIPLVVAALLSFSTSAAMASPDNDYEESDDSSYDVECRMDGGFGGTLTLGGGLLGYDDCDGSADSDSETDRDDANDGDRIGHSDDDDNGNGNGVREKLRNRNDGADNDSHKRHSGRKGRD